MTTAVRGEVLAQALRGPHAGLAVISEHLVSDASGRCAACREFEPCRVMSISPAIDHAAPSRDSGLSSPVLVAVIGPPGAGKSTIVRGLAHTHSAPVFRLRETIRARPELLAGLVPSPDPLGWVSLEAVRRVLTATFFGSEYAADPVVLLDNFPGTAGQLSLLAETAGQAGRRLALLELTATAVTAVARVTERRVCPACGPDPHAPAEPASDDAEVCSSCRTALIRRASDVPRLHGVRLARHLANRPEIAESAADHGIEHRIVCADDDLNAVRSRVEAVLSHLLTTATQPRGRKP